MIWRYRRFALGGGLRPGHGETSPKHALEVRPKRQPERATVVLFERNRQPAVEATFRSLKSEIGLRPIRHTQQDRIRAHFCIAVLAYHAVHVPSRRPDARGHHDSRTTIRRKLAGWVRLTPPLETVARERVECRQDFRPDLEAVEVARAVGVPPALHRVRMRTPVARKRRPTNNPAVP